MSAGKDPPSREQQAAALVSPGSPRTGAASASAPAHHPDQDRVNLAYRLSPGSGQQQQGRDVSYRGSILAVAGQTAAVPSLPPSPAGAGLFPRSPGSPSSSSSHRRRAYSLGSPEQQQQQKASPGATATGSIGTTMSPRTAASGRKIPNDSLTKARARDAQRVNDSMVYLDGAQLYSCGQCRTHLTSHDDIISKSFHGRHGRAYLFDQCVNVTVGPAEDRLLITGLHSVCDIFCKRCKTLVGWTYQKAYENSQKYKEGKFIIEKINLHLEESDCYDVAPPAGEKTDRWRKRSMSWGTDNSTTSAGNNSSIVYEYHPPNPLPGSPSPGGGSSRRGGF